MAAVIDDGASAPAIVELDITADTCPLTFVRTRLMLDSMAEGGVLIVRLQSGEPHRNVGRSVRALGHAVVSEVAHADGSIVLIIRKKAG
ncbi:sulfurtransferase TusA family protein [Acetobacter peroxydans]|jgi:TusA-related sulfurtransferase|uniref:UPF0033 domain-containing protein n=1 Tax=Acetobacter peroxydans TaxID=104098 RepID=A0A4Y3TXF2_9PROT|nr:sulfurtransferase TusA family protein [Acetobacter peroxydans]MCH4094911.1 sulfurtransferase TusA family protein [Acetobacter peroxydans]MCH4142165.1 sulfurtransferase TusA family protein [Acetobacter peroxydans]MCI1395252.1 sulfurtransferase TusA family protein [Acetobacter peroxydans]MCI1410925.1 sulfurtransferase TusA family protein [Acetobacter peroxydans]MCI1440336.1 sulfurtransferase TusA family protein [Acetobacter peroxydans]